MQPAGAEDHSLLRAFFRFSAPVAPPPVAALLTALVPGAGAVPITAIPIVVPVFTPTFASAVLRGEGEGCRSLLEDRPSFSAERLEAEDLSG